MGFSMLVLFTNKFHGILGWVYGLDWSSLSNRWNWGVLDERSLVEYAVNAGFPQGSIFGPTCFLLYLIDLPDDFFCNFVIYADNTIVHSKFDQASDLWQQLKLASKLESDLRDTADCCRKWLVGLNAWKTQLVLFEWVSSWGKNIFWDSGTLFLFWVGQGLLHYPCY